MDKSILSKDTLYRLGVLDPNLFLNETEDEHNYSINNLSEQIDKRTDCEKSMTKDEDGNIKCKCQKRTLPPNFNEKAWEADYNALIKRYGEKSDIMEKFLKKKFSSVRFLIYYLIRICHVKTEICIITELRFRSEKSGVRIWNGAGTD